MDALTEALYNIVNAWWAAFLETILYSIFGVLLLLNICIVKTRGRTSAMKPALIVQAAMFLVATIHLGSNLFEIYVGAAKNALLVMRITGTDMIFDGLSNGKAMQRSVLASILVQIAFVAQIWLGDGFMLFRLWKVWNSDKRVVIPHTVGFIADVAFGILALYQNAAALVDPEKETMGPNQIARAFALGDILYMPLIAVSLAVHISCSGVISSSITPLIGITFSIIITRMGLGISVEMYVKARRKESRHVSEAAGTTGITNDSSIVFAQVLAPHSIELSLTATA
ncbi:hypothetical protein CONPUDRAFT_77773 [Coniophora puteana RWD-64-598 SS2]|uniref:Uncharacterized protein n=1 Tax=Coniophora puteana (strain RWD-64-598) TaxID=741705 RepID=A0A5M3M8I7_CONPW|nr:uncharacterized protein CONPUDRAFT_77773 [Coniophora puteana RWD-64-598 SS2]EIW74991.1 hypothetical protein CONPUDRAFT_77773 [Coniophora puteana RWD-64-598 SS2]